MRKGRKVSKMERQEMGKQERQPDSPILLLPRQFGFLLLRNGKLWNVVEQGRRTPSITEEYQSGGNRQHARKEQIAGRGPV